MIYVRGGIYVSRTKARYKVAILFIILHGSKKHSRNRRKLRIKNIGSFILVHVKHNNNPNSAGTDISRH